MIDRIFQIPLVVVKTKAMGIGTTCMMSYVYGTSIKGHSTGPRIIMLSPSWRHKSSIILLRLTPDDFTCQR